MNGLICNNLIGFGTFLTVPKSEKLNFWWTCSCKLVQVRNFNSLDSAYCNHSKELTRTNCNDVREVRKIESVFFVKAKKMMNILRKIFSFHFVLFLRRLKAAKEVNNEVSA